MSSRAAFLLLCRREPQVLVSEAHTRYEEWLGLLNNLVMARQRLKRTAPTSRRAIRSHPTCSLRRLCRQQHHNGGGYRVNT